MGTKHDGLFNDTLRPMMGKDVIVHIQVYEEQQNLLGTHLVGQLTIWFVRSWNPKEQAHLRQGRWIIAPVFKEWEKTNWTSKAPSQALKSSTKLRLWRGYLLNKWLRNFRQQCSSLKNEPVVNWYDLLAAEFKKSRRNYTSGALGWACYYFGYIAD